MFVFDIESDGLLFGKNKLTKVHCINAIDRATGREYRWTDHEFYRDINDNVTDVPCPRDGTILDGLNVLAEAETLGGQNIIGYDIPALQIVYPDWQPTGEIVDSVVMSRVMYTNLKDRDFAALRKGKLPEAFQKRGLIGTHKLEAWGYRLGGAMKGEFNPKDFGHTWRTMPFTQVFDDYCMDDVVLNVEVLEHFENKRYSQEALDIEHAIAQIVFDQEVRGWAFDVEGAKALTTKLMKRKLELEDELRAVFPPWEKFMGIFVPKRNNKAKGYVKGVGIKRYKTMDFNPASRDHIADRLTAIHGWVPLEKTPSGKPKVDETIIEQLTYPEAPLIAEYLTIGKRLGQIADGKQAWLKSVKEDGRIHGRVVHNGAVTGRMTHSGPNVAQTPANGSLFGRACRALWTVAKGLVLVGCDADGLELRMLAHYLARYDGGAYTKVILEGKKSDGTDMHTRNQNAVGLRLRDSAKTMFYAWLYGAGDYKLGTVYIDDMTDEARTKFYATFAGNKLKGAICKLGKRSRLRLVEGIPGMDKLIKAVTTSAKKGSIRGLDGRSLHIRSPHAALNTLLQSAGAIIMKKAQILLNDTCSPAFVGTIHDEWQMESVPEKAEELGTVAARAIVLAGEWFNLRCPLAGNFDIGNTWAETH